LAAPLADVSGAPAAGGEPARACELLLFLGCCNHHAAPDAAAMPTTAIAE